MKLLSQHFFNGSLLSIFFNPFFFARRGLYKNIQSIGQHITGKTLDVGCGQKPYESLFAATEYIGMDIEQSGHDHSTSKIDIFYDGKTFPFENQLFDSIVCNQTIEHIFNPDEVLKEINRVTKLNGNFVLSVPFVWDEHEQPYDYARYSSFGLNFLLEKYGFKVITHIKSVNTIEVIFQLIAAYIYKTVNTTSLFRRLLGKTLIMPFNIIGFLLAFILPKNNDLYLDNIILAKKTKNL